MQTLSHVLRGYKIARPLSKPCATDQFLNIVRNGLKSQTGGISTNVGLYNLFPGRDKKLLDAIAIVHVLRNGDLCPQCFFYS